MSTILTTRPPSITSTETIMYTIASNARLQALHLKNFVAVNGDYNAHTRILTVNLADGRQITFMRQQKGPACYHHLAVCNILTAGGVFPSLQAAKEATFGEWTPNGDYASRSFFFAKSEEGCKVILTDYV